MDWTIEKFKERTIISALLPYDDQESIETLLNECQEYKGIAVLPSFMKLMYANGNIEEGLNLVGMVGFPYGGVTSQTKISEIREMNYFGAVCFDLIMNTGFIISNQWDDVECELVSAIKTAKQCPLIVTIETAYLQEDQVTKVAQLCKDNGVEVLNSSSGLLPKLPTVEQLRFLRFVLDDAIKLQVTGIHNYDQFADAVQAGAEQFMIRQQHADAILAQLANS